MATGVCGLPLCYSIWQKLFLRQKHAALSRALRRFEGRRLKILDAGCGTGQAVPLLRDAARFDYVGADADHGYVRHAAERFPSLKFVVVDLRCETVAGGPFDVVLIESVLHHLSDEDAGRMLANMLGHLSPGGACLIQDMVYPEFRSVWGPLQRMLIKMDNGRFCRSPSGLDKLIRAAMNTEECFNFRFTVAGVPLYNMISCTAIARRLA